MKICLVHNYYQISGGEDSVYKNEKELLLRNGHEVVEFTRHNDEIKSYSGLQKAAMLYRTTHNRAIIKDFQNFLRLEAPDIIHCHNTFPLISPAVLSVGKACNIPLIQTLHNFRFFCPNGLFYRDGGVCEDCFKKKIPFAAVKNACYRDSKIQSLAVAGMLAFHQWQETWKKDIDRFIAISAFVRSKFLQAGYPAEKFVVKPNFVVSDPGKRGRNGDYYIYVGRLSKEKGIETLLKAWQRMPEDIKLKIIGDGPLSNMVESAVTKQQSGNLEYLGRVDGKIMMSGIKGARSLIFPSECYETFGLTVAEAYACGVPVIASRIGAVQELIEEGVTGEYFSPGNTEELYQQVLSNWENPEKFREMGINARKVYEEKYSAASNYRMLIKIYQDAIAAKEEVTA